MPELNKSVAAAISLSEQESGLLGVSFGSQKITPGQFIPRKDAQSPPELSWGGATGTYIVVELDLDAPFPSLPLLGPILHWRVPGLKPQQAANGATTSLVSSDATAVGDYAPPRPPPPSAPHRYVFMLYEQPEGFDPAKFAPPGGKKLGVGARIRYDLEAFEKAAKLGPVVAGNYFLSK